MILHACATATEAAVAAAGFLAEEARRAIAERDRFAFASSGGHTPWEMYEAFSGSSGIAWEKVEVWQVDERVAPLGSPARNLTNLERLLPSATVKHPMPVDEPELVVAAAVYSASLPDRFDLVHLGLGADGHTASLPVADPVIGSAGPVVLTEFSGYRRMTMTLPVLNRARVVLWLVTGADKPGALSRLLSGDTSIPASSVGAPEQHLFTDPDAYPTPE